MLDLPSDNEGLAWIVGQGLANLLLIPGIHAASIIAASMGDQQALGYLRFTAQHHAAFASINRLSKMENYCTAAACSSSQVDQDTLLQQCRDESEAFDDFSEVITNMAHILEGAVRTGKLAALKWLRGLCHPDDFRGSFLMEIAAEKGHLAIMRYLRSGPKPAEWGAGVAANAARHPDCLKWLLSQQPPCPCGSDLLLALARLNDMETLQWIRHNSKAPVESWTATVLAVAACSGNLSLVQWLHSIGCAWSEDAIAAAARRGDLPMLQYLRGQDPPCPWSIYTSRCAAASNHLHVLQWLRSQQPPCPWDEALCKIAAGQGSIDMLRWLRSQVPPCNWDDSATLIAACKGKFKCLKWLIEHGAPLTTKCTAAAANGSLDVLEWLRSRDPPCPWDVFVSSTIASQGDLVKLQWLHSQGCPFDGTAYVEAANLGHMHVLKWLSAVAIPVPQGVTCALVRQAPTAAIMYLGDIGHPLSVGQQGRLSKARRTFCTFHGLLRWCRRAVGDPSHGIRNAFNYSATHCSGQELLVRLAQLPHELLVKIAAAADLQHNLME